MDLKTLLPLCTRCLVLVERLNDVEKSIRVRGLITTLLDNPNWPDFKIGIWLGCAETILIENGVSTYAEERNFSREIKHKYYCSIGAQVPPTIDVMEIL